MAFGGRECKGGEEGISGAARLPVIDPADRGRIVGWASQVRALAAYNRELIASSVEEHR